MFTKIHLKNFKSFNEIVFDLSDKKNNYKNFAVIYGENGVGKSNLVLGFSAFIELLQTMNVRDIINNLLDNEQYKFLSELSKREPQILFQLHSQFRDMKRLISEYKTVGSEAPILLEYEFIINDKHGSYSIELSPKTEEITHEKLEYTIDKNKGVYYDLTPTEKRINSKIFYNADIYSNIKDLINKFWGKHSFLSILLHEKNDKSEKYIATGLSENFKILINQFTHVSCLVKSASEERGMLSNIPDVLLSLEHGTISNERIGELERIAQSLTILFNTINPSTKELFYRTSPQNNAKTSYNLFVRKIVSGEEKELDFKLESTGYHQILRIFPFLLSSLTGGISIIDEIDAGIHDVLIQKIIEEALPHIDGQLIITSHNTMIMEIDEARDSVYIMSEDMNFNKQIRCIGNYRQRTYQQNNIRSKYLNHAYEGIPKIERIDFEPFKALFSSTK